MAESDLLLIPRRSGALKPLMAPGPGQSTVPPHEIVLPAQVTPAQGELDEFAHLDRKYWLRTCRHPPSFRV